MSAIDSALMGYGLVYHQLNYDGELHRCGTKAKPRSKNGWYIVYDNGKSACFGNWENGEGFQFWREDGEKFTAVDYERIDAMKKAREEAYTTAAIEASEFLDQCAKTGHSEYLAKKRVDACGALFDGTTLILPCMDAKGKIWSYQRILADGSKFFMAGGKTKGCYFPIFPARQVEYTERVIVCEGFATGAAIHKVTGLPVIVAFSAGNLKAVADSLPYRNILIAADNDASGTGEKYASQSGYRFVMPKVEGWDYNDAYLDGRDIQHDFIDKPVIIDEPIVAHGIVGEIAEWITRTATRPQPVLSLAAALAFVGMMKGHRVRGRTNLRTNILALALAPTQSGKEHPQYCISYLAKVCNLDQKIMGEPVSGAGFLTALQNNGRISLMVMDELGRYLSNIMSKNGSGHQREIIDYIIKTFSCANRMLKGKAYANIRLNPQINIDQPHFCCLGSTVPEKLINACSSSDIVDGFLNRWLLFETESRPKKNMTVKFEPPPEHVVQYIIENSGGIYDPYGDPIPHEVTMTPEAWAIFTEYSEKMESILVDAPHPLPALYGRACEHVEKIALILCDDQFIGVHDINLAIRIVERSNQSIKGFAGMIFDNSTEGEYIRVRKIIREAKEMTKSELSRTTQFITGGKRRRDEILDALVEQNLIAIKKDGKAISYRWIG